MGNSILEQEVFLFSGYKNKKWSTTKVVIGRPQKMLEQTTVEVIAINDHRKCHRGDHTTVIVIMPRILTSKPSAFVVHRDVNNGGAFCVAILVDKEYNI